jgi:prepilin-type N-terminal cleavage/methylation domain-containing protein
MIKIVQSKAGLTLIEIMVSMVISSLVISGIYGVYTIQQRSYTVQEQVAELQQRLRSAMSLLAGDIRMVGSNPDYEGKCSKKILTATADKLEFNACNMDQDGDDYKIEVLYDNNDKKLYMNKFRDMKGNGRKLSIAGNTENFTLTYYDNNNDEISFPVPDLSAIRSVEVSLTVRSTYPDPKYTDSDYNDHYHRRSLTNRIFMRNMM